MAKKIKILDELKLRVPKSELFEFYIVENHNYNDTMKRFSIKTCGNLRALLNFYGIHKDKRLVAKLAHQHDTRTHEDFVQIGKKSSVTQKQAWNSKSEEEKLAWKNLQIANHHTQEYHKKQSEIQKKLRAELKLNNPQKEKEINLKRSISCKKIWENLEVREKQKSTYKNNRQSRLCSTEAEQKIFNVLSTQYPTIQYDVYVDDRYPYYVDFYIKELDLFIEYQGHPSHGTIPYDKNNIDSLNEACKLYGKWLDTYTRRDVEKFQKACSSNINLIRIYPNISLEENFKINNYKYSNIIEIIFKSQNKKFSLQSNEL